MPDRTQSPTLHYYLGAYGPTLMFQMYDETHLVRLKTIFLSLADGKAAKVSLKDAGLVAVLDGIGDLVFVLLSHASSLRMVKKVRDTPGGPMFEFFRNDEG